MRRWTLCATKLKRMRSRSATAASGPWNSEGLRPQTVSPAADITPRRSERANDQHQPTDPATPEFPGARRLRQWIRVNSVHPGFIWTPLVEELARNSPEGLEAFRRKLDSRHPIGHVGEPDDVAYGIVYLASDEAKFVTGSELVIDGGYTAR